jgi:nicotinamidase-related amidase
MRSALLIVDMINTFDFPGGEDLLRRTRPIVPVIAGMKMRARKARSPVIYCNDNFGRWRSDFRALIERCTSAKSPGHAIAQALQPGPDDYFILKPRHSAFYQTPLETLLQRLGARRLVLVGIAGDSCIHATAVEGHEREYDVVVVSDASASQSAVRQRRALAHLEDTLSAKIKAARGVRF